jgi:hypothetical protein
METQAMLARFNGTVDVWEAALENYSEEQLRQRPDAESWSMGQVYAHLVEGTLWFHLKQVETCLTRSDHADAGKTFPGRMAYWLGAFPPIRIKVPASPEYTPRQPESKARVRERLAVLRREMAQTAARLTSNPGGGKTRHPAFGYLGAREWFQLIDMHFRHHLRQKKRIEKSLRVGSLIG